MFQTTHQVNCDCDWFLQPRIFWPQKPHRDFNSNKHRVFRSACASGSIMFTLQKESDDFDI